MEVDMKAFDITELLLEGYNVNASDVHLSAGTPPVFRIYGDLVPQAKYEPYTSEELSKFLTDLIKSLNLPLNKKEVDFSFSLKNVARVRANVFLERGNLTGAFRIITYKIRNFSELGLPQILADFANHSSGIVLIAGPTGSGKSTTLAAMIDKINQERPVHIITIEDPIEYIFQNKQALIHQRQLGNDTDSFSDGLKYALRQDPDVILVGEMRDIDTMKLALTAAETGHLVFSTIHTNSAGSAPERIIDVFPEHQQKQVAIQLSNTLVGVAYQRLLPAANGKGYVPIVEILTGTVAVRNLIRENKLHQIDSMIETGGKFGMITFDEALKRAISLNKIKRNDAIMYAKEPANL
jgi:twitching motility protein PilT